MFFLYISNTINPVIYSGMNSAFRGEFRRIITCISGGVVSSQRLQRRSERESLQRKGPRAQPHDVEQGIQQDSSV